MMRKATLDDVDSICTLIETTLNEMPHPEWLAADTREEVIDTIDSDGAIFLYCDDDTGKILGVVMVELNAPCREELGAFIGTSDIRVIGTCVVSSEARGRHIQKMLLQIALIEYGPGTYMASIHHDNIASLTNFKNCGFKVVTHAKVWGNYDRDIHACTIK